MTSDGPSMRGGGGPWTRAAGRGEHPVAAWDGAPLGDDLTLMAWLGPANAVGARYFRLALISRELGASSEPIVLGLHNAGRYPGYNWVEVTEYRDRLTMDGGQTVDVPPAVERALFRRLAELVPPGGHLMAEYDSPARRMTARALVAGVPPRATPLGATLAAAGCIAFRDWYISEGGREGRRKLQGFLALDDDHARRRDEETLASLHAFMDASAHLEWDLQARTRRLAEEAIAELEARLRRGAAASGT